ncbi:MAG: SGNH/GDSL hydrolase family protein [Legionellaceae bacterium]|nr:SGNH/GDSL hydrolase family protein [Legionellaceae bacterium]
MFGDSLSDIGNFPESATRLYPGTHKISQHIYLPARNPVNLTKTHHYAVPGLPNVVLSYPDVNTQNHLPAQKPLDGATRHFQSINWPQYLLHEAKLADFIEHDNITPWITFFNDEKSPTVSVNYAYYGALTTNDCHDQDYGNPSPCDRTSIYQTQQAYRYEPQDIIDMNSVQVPGFQKQVALFTHDLQQQKVSVDNHTAIIIMIGANDIAFAAEKIQSLKPSEMWDATQTLAGGITNNVVMGLKQILQTSQTKHLYIMNLYNLGLIPKIYSNKAMSITAEQLTKIYNYQLSNHIDHLRQEYSDVYLNIYDTYTQFETQAQSDLFKDNLGRQCDEDSQYLTPNGSPVNCNADDEHHAYLFWNRAHPSSLVDQFIAHGLLKFIQTTWTELSKTPSTPTNAPLSRHEFNQQLSYAFD